MAKNKEIFSMWKKNGNKTTFYTGKYNNDSLIGFTNGMKKNPNEPDIRIYRCGDDGKKSGDSFVSLWIRQAKSGTTYLGGTMDGKRVVGFKSKSTNPKAPDFTLYFSEEKPENRLEF